MTSDSGANNDRGMERATFEDVRARIGLTKVQLLGLMGLEREAQLDPEDPEQERILTHIWQEFEAYVEHVKRAIDWEFRTPDRHLPVRGKQVPVLSTVQAARALGVGEFHLSNLRDRKKLPGTPFGRRSFYTKDALLKFLRQQTEQQQKHMSLAGAFVRWYQLRQVEPEREAALA